MTQCSNAQANNCKNFDFFLWSDTVAWPLRVLRTIAPLPDYGHIVDARFNLALPQAWESRKAARPPLPRPCMGAGLLSLPAEMLDHICTYLTAYEDILALACTCFDLLHHLRPAISATASKLREQEASSDDCWSGERIAILGDRLCDGDDWQSFLRHVRRNIVERNPAAQLDGLEAEFPSSLFQLLEKARIRGLFRSGAGRELPDPHDSWYLYDFTKRSFVKQRKFCAKDGGELWSNRKLLMLPWSAAVVLNVDTNEHLDIGSVAKLRPFGKFGWEGFDGALVLFVHLCYSSHDVTRARNYNGPELKQGRWAGHRLRCIVKRGEEWRRLKSRDATAEMVEYTFAVCETVRSMYFLF
ncbi:hypothetical protein ACQY0O_003671 [Thecaphora frezii]